jgi:hypothetical protein
VDVGAQEYENVLGFRVGTLPPLFCFHYVSAQRFVCDDRGSELPSLRSAHMHALGLIARSIRLMNPAHKQRWTVQISDDAGRLLLTAMFPSLGLRVPAFQSPRAGSEPPASPQLSAGDTPGFLRAYAAALRKIDARPDDGRGADPSQ